jgi:hypothetical protein
LPEAAASPAPVSELPQPPRIEEHPQRFAPSGSPFAEKLQQAWRKDS